MEQLDRQDWVCPYQIPHDEGKRISDTGLQPDDWRIPYIGSLPTAEFEKEFQYNDAFLKSNRFIGIHKFDWEDHPDYVDENHYDESNYRHFLLIRLFESGPMRGRIKSIEAHHRNYWHTDSDWHDHSKNEVRIVRGSDGKEIAEYRKLLDVCTKSCARDEADEFFKTIVSNSDEFNVLDGKLRGPHEFSISVENMANFITLARSFLEVFFLGDVMERQEDLAAAFLSERSSLDFLEKGFESFLDRMDIKGFYEGADLEKLKQEFLIRVYKRSACVQRFLGASGRVYGAMIKSMIEERIDSSSRKLKWRGQECFPWERDSKVQGPARGPWLNEPSGIPDGSLCFFNRKRSCVGYVTKDCRAFKLACKGDNVSIGGLAFDGMVYNSKGECIGRGKDMSAIELFCGNVSLRHHDDLIEVGEQRKCRNYVSSCNHKYVGYVRECKCDSCSARCEKYVWNNVGCDMRWIGLAMFGYVDEELIKREMRKA